MTKTIAKGFLLGGPGCSFGSVSQGFRHLLHKRFVPLPSLHSIRLLQPALGLHRTFSVSAIPCFSAPGLRGALALNI